MLERISSNPKVNQTIVVNYNRSSLHQNKASKKGFTRNVYIYRVIKRKRPSSIIQTDNLEEYLEYIVDRLSLFSPIPMFQVYVRDSRDEDCRHTMMVCMTLSDSCRLCT